jgi:hypothetical protein
MSAISNFFNSGIGYFSGDVIFLVTLFVVFFVYALYFGKNSIISVILAFYPAQFFYANFPFMNSLLVLKGDWPLLLNKVLIFLIFWVLLYILINRYVFHDSGYGGEHYVRMACYAIAMVIVVLIFSYSVVNLDAIHNFSPAIDALFAGADHIFLWNLAPLVVLFVL